MVYRQRNRSLLQRSQGVDGRPPYPEDPWGGRIFLRDWRLEGTPRPKDEIFERTRPIALLTRCRSAEPRYVINLLNPTRILYLQHGDRFQNRERTDRTEGRQGNRGEATRAPSGRRGGAYDPFGFVTVWERPGFQSGSLAAPWQKKGASLFVVPNLCVWDAHLPGQGLAGLP